MALNEEYYLYVDKIKSALADGGSRESFSQIVTDFIIFLEKYNSKMSEEEQEQAAELLSESENFCPFKQGNITNKLARVNVTKGDFIKLLSEQNNPVMLNAKTIGTDFKLMMLTEGGAKAIKPSTKKLLDAITIKGTKDGFSKDEIIIPVSEYMKMCNVTNEHETMKQIRADLISLGSITIEYKEHRSTGEVLDAATPLIDFRGVSDKAIHVTLADKFREMLISYPVMMYPTEILKINGHKFPNAHALSHKIAEHKNMNFDKPNADIISVKTLLGVCEHIPSVYEVSRSNRHYTDRIIEPFERDLTACSAMFDWAYCHNNNKPLTDEELNNFNLSIFLDAYVHITWRQYPDMSKRLEIKKDKKEKAKARAKTKK